MILHWNTELCRRQKQRQASKRGGKEEESPTYIEISPDDPEQGAKKRARAFGELLGCQEAQRSTPKPCIPCPT